MKNFLSFFFRREGGEKSWKLMDNHLASIICVKMFSDNSINTGWWSIKWVILELDSQHNIKKLKIFGNKEILCDLINSMECSFAYWEGKVKLMTLMQIAVFITFLCNKIRSIVILNRNEQKTEKLKVQLRKWCNCLLYKRLNIRTNQFINNLWPITQEPWKINLLLQEKT